MNRCKAREFTDPLPRKVTGATTLPQQKYSHDRGNPDSVYSDKGTVGSHTCDAGFTNETLYPQKSLLELPRSRCCSATWSPDPPIPHYYALSAFFENISFFLCGLHSPVKEE